MVSAASVFSVAGAVVDAVAEVFEAVLVEAGVSTLLLAVAVDATVAGLAASEVAFYVGFAASEDG